MFSLGASMSAYDSQQWAAFAAMSGQHALANPQAFQVGGMDSNGMVLGAIPPGYVRLAQASQASSVLPSVSIHSASSPCGPHQTLGYSIQPSAEDPISSRQMTNANLTSPYQLQQITHSGSVSQALPLSHPSLPYGQSFSYLQPLLPSAPMCNGSINPIQQCTTGPVQQGAPADSIGNFDPLKHFGALPHEQNRRNKPVITSKTNLYILGLNESDTDETVRSLVKDVVEPKSCKAILRNGTCKGYGFIDCASAEDAEKARNHIMEYAKINGRKLSAKFAHENEKDVFNVYVKHLPLDFTKEKLEELFQNYGKIVSVRLMENNDHLTGNGFVRYAQAEDAKNAIDKMNAEKLILNGNTAPVVCKLADKTTNRRRGPTTPVAAALMLQTSVPLSHLQRQNLTTNHAASLQRNTMALAQNPQQSPFIPTVPLAAQLRSPMSQPHVFLHNIQTPTASPQARGVLSPSLIPNGTSNPSMRPLLFPWLPFHALHTVIGPPPNTQNSLSFPTNQNPTNLAAARAYATSVDNVNKFRSNLFEVRVPNIPPGSSYVHNDNVAGDQSSVNGVQQLPQLSSLPPTLQYTPSYAQPHNIYPTIGCTYATPGAPLLSTLQSYNSLASTQHTYQLSHPNETTTKASPVFASQQQLNTHVSLPTLDSLASINPVVSDLQALSIKSTVTPQPSTTSDRMHYLGILFHASSDEASKIKPNPLYSQGSYTMKKSSSCRGSSNSPGHKDVKQGVTDSELIHQGSNSQLSANVESPNVSALNASTLANVPASSSDVSQPDEKLNGVGSVELETNELSSGSESRRRLSECAPNEEKVGQSQKKKPLT
ncbi:RNA-binding motif single-stranded-interacting protein 3 [Paragonimus heterotremus]|uniref:RNA-binding motif single-stranded-interacting protein 3 n=1 Tax=Paragonimus heterotremus TaxID=100268 RepID=A0A8J4SH56_9TREM|nr:RNA-binding motif single-stranded-interacting protein 3 [Paragonimus heterotremus]